VFKPNSEEFPFTIDIKDKTTGEAVIEVIRKEIAETVGASAPDQAEQNGKKMYLDCKKRSEYNFLIQAYDCSSPPLPSNKYIFI
jgi:hypothetical protein